jgi:hypothetical protein
MTEFYIWGTKNNIEDIIKVNGKLFQGDLKTAKKIKSILEKRGEFENIRIQEINLNKMFNFVNEVLK